MHNRAFLRAKDHRTSLPGPYSIMQYRIRGMGVRSFHLLRNFYGQYRIRSVKVRNHLKRKGPEK